MNILEEMNEELNELNQPTKTKPNNLKRYNSASGIRSVMKSKTQRITRKDRMDLIKSKDLNVLLGQLDKSFKMILSAADNTGAVEQFIIGKLNIAKNQITKRVQQEINRQSKND